MLITIPGRRRGPSGSLGKGLIQHWPLTIQARETGTRLKNLARGRDVIDILNPPKWTATKWGVPVLDTNGATAYGNSQGVPGSTNGAVNFPVGNAPRTISIWVYKRGTTTDVVFGYGTYVADSNTWYGCYIANATVYFFGLSSSDYATTGTITLNKWTHICWVFDGTNNKLYIDGVLIDSRAKTFATGSEIHYLGVNRTNNSSAFNIFDGMLAQYAMHNRALSQSEILYMARNFDALDRSVTMPLVAAPSVGPGINDYQSFPQWGY